MKRVDKTLYPVQAGAWSGGRIRLILKRGGTILNNSLRHKFTDDVEDSYSDVINKIWHDLTFIQGSQPPLFVQHLGAKR